VIFSRLTITSLTSSLPVPPRARYVVVHQGDDHVVPCLFLERLQAVSHQGAEVGGDVDGVGFFAGCDPNDSPENVTFLT
jgi:hypothetical protein